MAAANAEAQLDRKRKSSGVVRTPPTLEGQEIMGAIQDSPEPRSDAGAAATTAATAALLAELNPNTDLAWLVERVARNNLPWVVVSAAAVEGWEARDPFGWAKVSAWLAVKGVTIVRI